MESKPSSDTECKGNNSMKLCDMCINKDKKEVDITKLSMNRKINKELCKKTNAGYYKSKAKKH